MVCAAAEVGCTIAPSRFRGNAAFAERATHPCISGLASAFALWETGCGAVNLGATGHIEPAMLEVAPALLLIAEWTDVTLATICAQFGVACRADSPYGHDWRWSNRRRRVPSLVAQIAMIKSDWITGPSGATARAFVLVPVAQWRSFTHSRPRRTTSATDRPRSGRVARRLTGASFRI
jgi:hypothetical protein